MYNARFIYDCFNCLLYRTDVSVVIIMEPSLVEVSKFSSIFISLYNSFKSNMKDCGLLEKFEFIKIWISSVSYNIAMDWDNIIVLEILFFDGIQVLIVLIKDGKISIFHV